MNKTILYALGLILILSACQSSQTLESVPAPPAPAEPGPVEPRPAEPPAPPAEPVPPAPEDREGPILAFHSPIEYFSPDGDGENDLYIGTLSVQDESPIRDWNVEIREPAPPYALFTRVEGEGDPPEEISWDGTNEQGELVQSASDYLVRLTVTDVKGNSSTLEGVIETDILVIRDGDRLKIQVPSIMFAADRGDFGGLSEEALAGNERILRRLAQVLNKFGGYQVLIEGHGNTVLRTAREEEQELQPLSEARAKTVMEELVRYGVDRGRLSAAGRGGGQPVVPYEDREGWWKNRRVEFILIK